MKDRMPLLFFLSSMAVMGLFMAAIVQATRPSWKTYQEQFFQLEAQQEPNAAAKNAVLKTPATISQIILPGLQRVDRCTTCHMGVDDPSMKKAAQPFTYHANVALHPPSKFGCTVCHGGQGLGTGLKDAHGDVEHWEQPLLTRSYVRASCGQCHTRGDIPGVPELTEGRHLFDTHGCRGCHKVNGIGGTIGPDLTHEGSTRRDPQWLEQHFLNPQKVSPTSAMPNFNFTAEQAKALTFYMLSLTGEEMGSYYTSKSVIPSAAYGRQLFAEKNCISCHAIGGAGNKTGPDLAGVMDRHTADWLDEHFVSPTLVVPDSTMPAYDLDPNARAALIRFMGSATAADAQSLLAGRTQPLTAQDSAVEAGKMAFEHYGCVGCHGIGAVGGLPNPNSQGGQVPSLLHVADDYKKPEVISIILKGKMPPLADPKKPAPPLYMPSWKGTVNDEDVKNIVEYLWSLQPKETSTW
jgi:mono/diheme cytochrome c family protein